MTFYYVIVAFYVCLCTGQLLVYDNNKVTPVSEEIVSKEKFSFLHLAWSLDSTYLLSVSSDVSDHLVCRMYSRHGT